jgi:glutamyl-tRNA synthetase
VAWFDGTCLAHSPAQLDFDKLRWVNQHYMRLAGADNLLENLDARLKTRGLLLQSLCSQATRDALELFRDRVSTLEELCDWFGCLLRDPALDDEGVRQGLARALVPQTAATAEHFVRRLDAIIASEGSGNRVNETLAQWNAAIAGQILKEVLAAQGAKMPWLAIPLRLWCFGRAQTPAVEAMLALLPPSVVAQRVRAGLARLQAANV